MRRTLTLAIPILLACAGAALAQAITGDNPIRPDNFDPIETQRPIVEYALAGGFLIAVLAIAFKNSKRGHASS